MNKSTQLSIILIASILGFACIGLFYGHKTQRLQRRVDYQETVISKDKFREISTLKSLNEVVENINLKNSFVSNIGIKEIVTENFLIIRKPYFGCGDCFGDALELMKLHQHRHLKFAIVFSFEDFNDFISYSNLFQLDLSTTFNSTQELFPELDSISNYYLLRVNSELQILNTFIGEPGKEEELVTFLKAIM